MKLLLLFQNLPKGSRVGVDPFLISICKLFSFILVKKSFKQILMFASNHTIEEFPSVQLHVGNCGKMKNQTGIYRALNRTSTREVKSVI